jgi:queuine/archaeosine tRNA-ribosyltransferase
MSKNDLSGFYANMTWPGGGGDWNAFLANWQFFKDVPLIVNYSSFACDKNWDYYEMESCSDFSRGFVESQEGFNLRKVLEGARENYAGEKRYVFDDIVPEKEFNVEDVTIMSDVGFDKTLVVIANIISLKEYRNSLKDEYGEELNDGQKAEFKEKVREDIEDKLENNRKKIFSVKPYRQALKDYYSSFNSNGNSNIVIAFDLGSSYKSTIRADDKTLRLSRHIFKNTVIDFLNQNPEDMIKTNIEFHKEAEGVEGSEKLLYPVPGSPDSPDAFIDNLKKMKEMEDIEDLAIPALGRVRDAEVVSKVIRGMKETLDSEDVYIHGLGLGGLTNIPLAVVNGVDSLDVSTPWNRAFEYKLYHSVISKDGEWLNGGISRNRKVKIKKGKAEYAEKFKKCGCYTCRNFEIEDLVEMRKNGKNYAAKLLILRHNVNQHKFLMKYCEEKMEEGGVENLVEFIEEKGGSYSNSFSETFENGSLENFT